VGQLAIDKGHRVNPVKHPSTNDTLTVSEQQAADGVVPLPITRVQLGDERIMACASFWQPDADELARLAAGKPVRLMVWGRTHAPISVGVDDGELG
jgi:uncharacterized protein (DUF2461 family)